MDIYVVLFPDFTALDFIGPVEALARIDGAAPRRRWGVLRKAEEIG